MPAPCFTVWSQPTGALTAPPTLQPTAAVAGTVRTMQQLAAGAATALRPIEWGYILGTLPAAPVTFELVDTGLIFASGLVAHVAAGIHKVNVPAGSASQVQLGTALTGYYNGGAAPTEGTITATRLMDFHNENGLYLNKQYPLGREWELPGGNCLRVRVTPTTAAAVNVLTYITYEE